MEYSLKSVKYMYVSKISKHVVCRKIYVLFLKKQKSMFLICNKQNLIIFLTKTKAFKLYQTGNMFKKRHITLQG